MTKKSVLAMFAAAWVCAASHAQVVGVFTTGGGYAGVGAPLASYLNSQGFTASSSDTYPANFSAFNAVIMIRSSNPGVTLTNWVAAGGLLITEWDSTDWAAPLIGASISGGGFIGTNTPITFTGAGLAAGLGLGLTNPYSDAGATEFFRNFSSTGSGTVWATRGGSTPVIVAGTFGSGRVILMSHDWADTAFEGGAFDPANTDPSAVLVRNALRTAGGSPVPEPSTYGLMGALALVAFVARKRFKRA